MPTEYYVGIAVALILICLLALLFKPRQVTRRVVQQKSVESDQLNKQLSRIADSLEILIARLGASPLAEKLPVEKPQIQERTVEKLAAEEASIPIENVVQPADAVDTNDTKQGKEDQPPERHVRLSMFGR